MKHGSLKADIIRVVHADADEPVFDMQLQNPMCPNGRSFAHRVLLSWEDLVAIYTAVGRIVERQTDSVSTTALLVGSTPFIEVVQ
jgi:hypothetical protein